MRRVVFFGVCLCPAVVLLLACLPLLAATPEPVPAKGETSLADRILIEKSKRRLTLLLGHKPIGSYPVSLGRVPRGKKTEKGDGRTPEGVYTIDGRNSKSKFHLALHISYPNAADRAQAKARGVSPGSDIMIHGQLNVRPGGFQPIPAKGDWTTGCIAVSNKDIEEIWKLVRVGTPVEIVE